jgi:hypothetical protein
MMLYLQPHAYTSRYYRDQLWSLSCGCCGDDGKGKSMFARSLVDVRQSVAPTAVVCASVHCIDHREIASDVRKKIIMSLAINYN